MEIDLHKRTTLSTATKINTLLYAYYLVVIADLENNLQRTVFMLQNTTKYFGMEILPEKSGRMAFLGQNSVRCKIFVDKKMFTKVKNFKYFGCEIAHENYIQQNVAKLKINWEAYKFILNLKVCTTHKINFAYIILNPDVKHLTANILFDVDL
jgi:hypothetical protein